MRSPLRRSQARKSRTPLDIAVVLLLILAIWTSYKYAPTLLPRTDLSLKPVAGCDLNRQACSVDIPDGGRIELTITPHPIPVSKPLRVSVETFFMTANKIEIDLTGENMNMGYNRWPLRSDGKDHYIGEATIPICITGRMAWRATLIVETDRQRIAIPYVFEAPVH